jgi:DnaJ family protein C protein 3
MMKQMGKSLDDLNTLIGIDSSHLQGRTLRAKLLAQQGELLSAAQDQSVVVQLLVSSKKSESRAKAARSLLDKMTLFGNEWEQAKRQLEHLAADSPMERRRAANAKCAEALHRVIQEFAKDSIPLRIRRTECALANRDTMAASDELKVIIARDPQNLYAATLNAQSFRTLGATEAAKKEVKRCLSLDPEFAPCIHLHKVMRQSQKQVERIESLIEGKNWQEALNAVDEAFELESDPPHVGQLMRWRCSSYEGLREVQKGLDACHTLLRLENGDQNPQMADTHLTIADLHIMNDNLDEAEAAVRKAREVTGGNHQRLQEYEQKIQKLRQAASRKDYYKILQVKKTATNNDIRRAFRKLAKLYHPDQLRAKEMTPQERDKMDELFRDINEAKEVLMDEEKRQRYDNGEDVTKPAGQGNPFQGTQFHFQHGGGGFQGFPGGFPGGGFQFHFG